MKYTKEQYALGALRLGMGWLFLWAFIDKLFGLGFATLSERSWLSGASPTKGFLINAAKGPFQSVFQALAEFAIVDWLFMLGLLGIGLSLMLGAGIRVATTSGIVLMFLMWLALLPPTNNPFLDEHIVYILVFLVLRYVPSGSYLGLGSWWTDTSLVKKHPWLT